MVEHRVCSRRALLGKRREWSIDAQPNIRRKLKYIMAKKKKAKKAAKKRR
jgi:hypothetical protein